MKGWIAGEKVLGCAQTVPASTPGSCPRWGMMSCRENLSCLLCMSVPICPWETLWQQLHFYRRKWKVHLKDPSSEQAHIRQILLSAGYTGRVFGMCQCLGEPFTIHFSRICFSGEIIRQLSSRSEIQWTQPVSLGENISSFGSLCQAAVWKDFESFSRKMLSPPFAICFDGLHPAQQGEGEQEVSNPFRTLSPCSSGWKGAWGCPAETRRKSR